MRSIIGTIDFQPQQELYNYFLWTQAGSIQRQLIVLGRESNSNLLSSNWKIDLLFIPFCLSPFSLLLFLLFVCVDFFSVRGLFSFET